MSSHVYACYDSKLFLSIYYLIWDQKPFLKHNCVLFVYSWSCQIFANTEIHSLLLQEIIVKFYVAEILKKPAVASPQASASRGQVMVHWNHKVMDIIQMDVHRNSLRIIPCFWVLWSFSYEKSRPLFEKEKTYSWFSAIQVHLIEWVLCWWAAVMHCRNRIAVYLLLFWKDWYRLCSAHGNFHRKNIQQKKIFHQFMLPRGKVF